MSNYSQPTLLCNKTSPVIVTSIHKETAMARCLLVALLASLVVSGHGARILAVFPTPSRSHIISFEALTRELASRGHEVTVISMFPQKTPLANYTDIVVPLSKFGLDKQNMFELRNKSVLEMVTTFSQIGNKICDHILGDPTVQEVIAGPDDRYDLLLVSVFCNECVLGFAHKFSVPTVGIASMGGMHAMLAAMGNTSPYSYTPNMLLPFTDRMTFVQRLVNTIAATVLDASKRFLQTPGQDSLMRHHFHRPEMPHVSQLEQDTSLLFINSHFSIGHPQPLMPNTVEVGGLHLKTDSKLPADLQKYLDEARDGVIYFSMGSNLKSAEMPEEKRRAFLEAFSTLKQRVLWKWEEERLPGQPGNVRLGKWLPQPAILAHPNVKVFITHGGLLSVQETIFYGVPMVAIPIFADQPLNAKRAQDMGIGLRLDFDNITTESLLWTLGSILGDNRYRERVREVSSRFRDQPTSPLERAVFWTEYVLRHGGAAHMRSPALRLAPHQYFLLDVALGAGLASLLLAWVGVAAIRLLSRGRRDKQKTQ